MTLNFGLHSSLGLHLLTFLELFFFAIAFGDNGPSVEMFLLAGTPPSKKVSFESAMKEEYLR
ncbi:hypothetical protein AXFE_08480 [Acidithrix ferrooxidans]|uniref:Uncharacterized protein n=1 Tax=Acidithrix ferrooxidans TaxID=1280514 RepID=A0A0D8HMG3_9ACTN|nr:hypothetical protein AXFE_08480 [Acidithrix ferrooxidans]